MSDYLSSRDNRLFQDYQTRIKFIKTASIKELVDFYQVTSHENPMALSEKVESFELKKIEAEKWELSFLIPGAFTWRESFTGTLTEICIRSEAYLVWANTDLGKQAIKLYLDH